MCFSLKVQLLGFSSYQWVYKSSVMSSGILGVPTPQRFPFRLSRGESRMFLMFVRASKVSFSNLLHERNSLMKQYYLLTKTTLHI